MMGRRRVGGLCVCMVVLWCCGASAQEFDLEGCSPRPIVGTVGYKTALHATTTNAQVFGAVGFAERYLFVPDTAFAFGMEINVLASAIRVPTLEVGSGCDPRARYGMHALDLFASASGMRFRIYELELAGVKAPIEVFYAGSATGAAMFSPDEEGFNNRVYSSYGYAAAGIGAIYAAPLLPLFSNDEDFLKTQGDFILGAQTVWPKVGTMRLGYVWSNGLYTNITAEKLKLFLTSLLGPSFDEFPLLRGGLEKLVLSDTVGATSLFGQQRLLAAPPDTNDIGEVLEEQANESMNVTSAHFVQSNIAGLMDVSVSYAFKPDFYLQEALLTLHGPGYENFRNGKGLASVGEGDFELIDLIALTGGIITIPSMPWYGVRGGQEFSFVLRVAERLKVGYNDLDTLAIFPYAVGGTNVNINISLGF